MNYIDCAWNDEEKKKSQENGKKGAWLLNDLALDLYQCCCSLLIQMGKPTVSELMNIQNHQISVPVSLFHAKEQGKDILLWPNIICLMLENEPKYYLWWEPHTRLFSEVKYMANMMPSNWPGSILSFPHLLGLSAMAYRSHCITFCSQLIWSTSQNRKYSPIALFLTSEWINKFGMTLNKFLTTDEVTSLTLVWFYTFTNSVFKKITTNNVGEKRPLHFNKWGYDSVNESTENTPGRQKACLEETGLPYLFFFFSL